MKRNKKNNKTVNKRIIITILIVLIILGLSFSIFIYVNENKKDNISNQDDKTNISDTDNALEDVISEQIILDYQNQFNNTDIIGELEIPNTNLKVPVAHTIDNEFYLNHLIDKSLNTIGSVFLDYRNRVNDRKIIVYGHNSQNIYTDFRVLENYLDWNYYLNHSDIYFRTMDKRNHYLIFSVYIATSDYRYINLEFTNDQYGYHLQYLKEQSIYETGINVDGDDEIIVLQTCYYNPMGSYLIIVGKKV